MTDLTEKLNAGRLYYVKKKNGKIVIRQAHLYSCLRTENATPYVDFDDNDIEKVLAPVPSYNEVQALKEENARLKGLLREFKEFIEEENPKDYTIMSERMDELLTKIEEVLK